MVRGDVHLTLTYVAGSTPRPGGSAFVLLNGNTVLEINPPEGPAGVQRIETVLTLRPGTNNLRMVANVFGGEDGTSAHLFGVCMGDPLLDCHYETDEPLASIDQDWRLVSP
jgi:hypothetical protein